MIGDRGPGWAELTLAGLIDAYFDGGDTELHRVIDGVGACPDCWRLLVIELIHQHVATVLHDEFVELGS